MLIGVMLCRLTRADASKVSGCFRKSGDLDGRSSERLPGSDCRTLHLGDGMTRETLMKKQPQVQSPARQGPASSPLQADLTYRDCASNFDTVPVAGGDGANAEEFEPAFFRMVKKAVQTGTPLWFGLYRGPGWMDGGQQPIGIGPAIWHATIPAWPSMPMRYISRMATITPRPGSLRALTSLFPWLKRTEEVGETPDKHVEHLRRQAARHPPAVPSVLGRAS
jgi:hypothetical protein